MRARRLFHEESITTDINMSPLIDMVFILLIFFIVTTVFVEDKGLTLNESASAAAGEQDENDTIRFTLTSGGEVLFEGRSLGTGGVSAAVRGRLQRESAPVIITVEEGVIASLLVRVIDEATLAGAETISLTSERTTNSP